VAWHLSHHSVSDREIFDLEKTVLELSDSHPDAKMKLSIYFVPRINGALMNLSGQIKRGVGDEVEKVHDKVATEYINISGSGRLLVTPDGFEINVIGPDEKSWVDLLEFMAMGDSVERGRG